MGSIVVDPYPWLNRELISSVLKSSKGEHFNLIDFQLNDAVGKGENYTSHLIRISVQYNDDRDQDPKKTAFVIKTTLNENMTDMIQTSSIFIRELAFYRDYIPKFDQFTKIIDPDYKCSPKCFRVSEEPLYILFEDLKEAEFRNIDRTIGLNFQTSEMLFRKLAKFHAIGALIYEQNPEVFVHHKKNLYGENTPEIIATMTSGMRQIQELSANWPGYEKHSNKLAKLLDVIWEKITNTYEYDPNTFNTLTNTTIVQADSHRKKRNA